MKDFDEERSGRDLNFRLGGKDFRFRPGVQQELVDAYWEALGEPDASNAQILTAMDELVLGGLEKQYHEQWREARGPDVDQPLLHQDIRAVIVYMLECMLDRPIESPSDSGSTSEPTGTSLTDLSQEPEEQSSAA